MTPEEIKAEQLINSFYKYAFEDIDGVGKWMNAKQCAIICVDEILKYLHSIDEDSDLMFAKEINELESVKQEIEKL